MKIAVNARFLLANKLEGIGRFTYEIVSRMVLQHPEDEFIFFFDRPFDASYVFAKNVTPVVLFPPTRHPVLIVFWFEWAVRRALRRYRADIFFSPDGFMSLSSNCKTVIVTHDLAYLQKNGQVSWSIQKFYEWFTPRYLRQAKKILTVSGFTKRDIIEHFPLVEDKLEVVYNSCGPIYRVLSASEQAEVRTQFVDGKQYFCYVGAVHPRKNVHRLIAAFDIFKTMTGSDFKLVLVGNFAWKTSEAQTAYERSPYQQDILKLGHLTDEVASKLIGAAFAITYVSLFEGFGLPLVEAMSCEVPCITSNCSSMPEVAGDAGLLVDPHSIQDIAAKLIQLYQDPELHQQLVANGRIQRRKFDWDESSRKVYAHLREVAST